MKQIGIKLADGSFYPILDEGMPSTKMLDLTTATDNQTTVMVDLYRSSDGTMDGAEYIETLQLDELVSHPNGDASLELNIELDSNDNINASLFDPETGKRSTKNVSNAMFVSSEKSSSSFDEDGSSGMGAALAAGAVGGAIIGASLFGDEDGTSANDFSDLDIPNDFDFTQPPSSTEANDEPLFPDDDFSSGDFLGESSNIGIDDLGQDNIELNDAGLNDVGLNDAELNDNVLDAELSENFSDDFFDTPTSVNNNFAADVATESINQEEGTMNRQTEKEIKKKTKVPVLICIICALICVIAAILLLLLKYNIFGTKQEQSAKSNQVIVQDSSSSVSNATSSKKDEIPPPPIVSKVNEVVVPPATQKVTPSAPVSTAKQSDDIIYRVKWGDTLWDISNAYYRNPWRYTKIARYNNIKNPDYIVSGTSIRIPAE